MIKDNQVHLNRAHVIVDGLLVAGSYMLSYYIKFESVFADKRPGGRLPMEVYFSALYFLVPAYLFLYYIVLGCCPFYSYRFSISLILAKSTRQLPSEIRSVILSENE